jgi:hypothetical protein
MTEEKRKRGRPPGSGKKKEVVLAEPTQFDKDFKEKGFGITPNKGILAVNGDKFKPLPDNWYSLSKTDKLQWLTANLR